MFKLKKDEFWRIHDWFWRIYDWAGRIGMLGALVSGIGAAAIGLMGLLAEQPQSFSSNFWEDLPY